MPNEPHNKFQDSPKETVNPDGKFVEINDFIFRPTDIDGVLHMPLPEDDESEDASSQVLSKGAQTLVCFAGYTLAIQDPEKNVYFYLRRIKQPQKIQN